MAMLVNVSSDTVTLLLHEQFHGYQATAFVGRHPQFVDPLAVKDRVAFAATAETERSILAAAVTANDQKQRKRLLRQYFALRRERERTLPFEVVKTEQGFERIEGTAKYVDRAASAVLSGGGESALPALIAEELNRKLGGSSAPYTTTWFRLRGYSTGAALTYLTSRFDAGDWRKKIEGGVAPGQMLEALVGAVPVRGAEKLAEAARQRFSYGAKRRELEPQIRAAEKTEIKSVAEFLALGGIALVFEPGGYAASARPGFSAQNMTLLSPSITALPRAMRFAVSADHFSVTVRERPVLLEAGKAPRYTALLAATPEVEGLGKLSLGKHNFNKLRMRSEGYELEAKVPGTVIVEPHRILVRLEGG